MEKREMVLLVVLVVGMVLVVVGSHESITAMDGKGVHLIDE
jgi:hypothetical protein